MKETRFVRLWLLGAVTAWLLATTTAQAEEVTDEARLYFKNGVDILQESTPNYADANHQFKLAYEKSGKSWKVLGNLGLCALKLERDGEALAYYAEYFRAGGDQVSADERAEIERELLLIKGNMATLKLSSDMPELTVSTQREGSTVARQAYRLQGGQLDLGVRAGTYLVTASHAGNNQTWQVVVTPGQTEVHTFTMNQAAPAEATARTKATTIRGIRFIGYVN
jgi:hypothetical protein